MPSWRRQGRPRRATPIPRFATEKERLEGALAALDGHFSKRTPLADEAALVRGSLLLSLGRADEAQAVYEKLLSGPAGCAAAVPGARGAGLRLRKEGQAGRGAGDLRQAGRPTPTGLGGFYKDRARYHEARLAELQGNPGEATRIYHEVLDKNPTTSLRDEISNRLALLELK